MYVCMYMYVCPNGQWEDERTEDNITYRTVETYTLLESISRALTLIITSTSYALASTQERTLSIDELQSREG